MRQERCLCVWECLLIFQRMISSKQSKGISQNIILLSQLFFKAALLNDLTAKGEIYNTLTDQMISTLSSWCSLRMCIPVSLRTLNLIGLSKKGPVCIDKIPCYSIRWKGVCFKNHMSSMYRSALLKRERDNIFHYITFRLWATHVDRDRATYQNQASARITNSGKSHSIAHLYCCKIMLHK